MSGNIPNYAYTYFYSFRLWSVEPDVEHEKTIASNAGKITIKVCHLEFYQLSKVDEFIRTNFPRQGGWVVDPWTPSTVDEAVDLVNAVITGRKRKE